VGRLGVRRTAVGVVVTAIIAACLVGALGLPSQAHASATQIAGAVPAPSASEASPLCEAPDPTAILGPEPSLVSHPVATVVSPTGGVDNFLATSSRIYVNTGSQFVTYGLTGNLIGSFSLPSGFSNGSEVSQPVVDPSGNIYLASYYGTKLSKFSPTGSLIWTTDPESGNPTGLFSVGTGASFQLMVSVYQDHAHSDTIDPTTGSINGTYPLIDKFGWVTQEADGNLLY
jgi:hypothetical protein